VPDISGIRPVPIARLAQKFSAAGVTPSSILILLKSDRYGLFSGPIKNALDALRIPAVVWTPDKAATNTSAGREMLALLRLSLDVGDDLAGRTAFQAGGLGVGNTAIAAVHQMAAAMAGMSFASAVAAVEANPASLGRSGSAVARAAAIVHDRLRTLAADAPMETSTISEVLDAAASLLEPAPALEAALGRVPRLGVTAARRP
jgi:superfamily I DNA/RNA helicase